MRAVLLSAALLPVLIVTDAMILSVVIERPYDNSGVNRRGVISWLFNLGMAGEWLHNHHHHLPSSPNFGLAGEIDSGYLACRVLALCRLASIREAPRLDST